MAKETKRNSEIAFKFLLDNGTSTQTIQNSLEFKIEISVEFKNEQGEFESCWNESMNFLENNKRTRKRAYTFNFLPSSRFFNFNSTHFN